ncbi:RNA polymerase sigma factor SigM [Solwaraspora sp. WMMD1047]|uniref:RNA polymerase sigma factor SigM n=1 Tax=Solwaraspora sp. WMMD1047 TaxID=3016102 RepID=UPI002415D6E9|nr:RNA polymerase sigma factor SigM [Solwaraspora sp. WMMD1047]MDG4834741.1 RNA polymerase sigma factor SigM [Solwaraspora sp. WMMD1047]
MTGSADRLAGLDDRELLRAHVDGDTDAFAEILRRHRDRLWAVALRTLGDREEAADALQDALLSAHRAAPRFRGDSAVTTWLHRIVVNACLDRIRRRQAHPTVPLPDGNRSEDAGTGGVEPAAPAPDLDTALVVRQALAALPVEQRVAIILVDVQGYPVAEVARMLDVAEGTVKSRCARGRARLAGVLGHLRPARAVPAPAGKPSAGGAPASRAAGKPPAGAVPDVRTVTAGNPAAGDGVRSGTNHSGLDRNQEDR